MKPKFKHDCDSCQFLGTYKNHDLYFCKQEKGWFDFIARYGDAGYRHRNSNEYSGAEFARYDGNQYLYEARKRAIAQGLLTQEMIQKYPVSLGWCDEIFRKVIVLSDRKELEANITFNNLEEKILKVINLKNKVGAIGLEIGEEGLTFVFAPNVGIQNIQVTETLRNLNKRILK